LVNFVRGKVSKKKRRFQQDGFDLDLSYILGNIIAMGFPSESLSGVYRNNMKDVQRLFNSRHPKKYKLYNLCSERDYQASHFEGRVQRYPFDDHNPSSFNTIEPFCKDVRAWLDSDPENIAAIHCKAGKGRTGFMIACYLMYSEFSPNADHALRYFAVKRTHNAKGVTIPSQIRYVHYFEKYLGIKRDGKVLPPRNPLLLLSIQIHTIPKIIRDGKAEVFFSVESSDSKYNSKGRITPDKRVADDYILFQAGDSSTGIASVDQDVLVTFYHSTLTGKAKMWAFWFNTRFLVPDSNDNDEEETYRYVLKKKELDKACKDKKHKAYSDGLRVELFFRSP